MCGSSVKRRVRVLVAVGHGDLRTSLVRLLSNRAAVEVAGEATTGWEVMEAVGSRSPDVVVLDMRLPGALWPDLVREIRSAIPAGRVVLLTPDGGPEYGQLAAEWGAATRVAWGEADHRLLDEVAH
jgi:two-component system, NarL family, response regulator DesR